MLAQLPSSSVEATSQRSDLSNPIEIDLNKPSNETAENLRRRPDAANVIQRLKSRPASA